MSSEGPSVQRRAFLESLLNAEGWSYRIVTNGPAFAEELRNGGYVSFLLLANRVKLENQVARELREAVFAGRGIVKAGARDHRNHHLLEVFGADLRGMQPHARGLSALSADAVRVPDASFKIPVRAVELRVGEGSAIAEYHGGRGQRRGIAAASAHRFGNGVSLLVGFDLLAQAEAEKALGAFTRFLAEALEYTHPETVTPRPGMSMPIRWLLANRGSPASVLLTLKMSGGRIIDPGHGALLGPGELAYALDMHVASVAEQEFWWLLPWDSESSVQVTATLDLQEGLHSAFYDVTVHDLAVVGLPTFADLEQLLQERVGYHKRYADALEKLQRAASLHQQNDAGKAVAHLLKAADWLSHTGDPEAKDIRVLLAWLIHRLGPEIRAD